MKGKARAHSNIALIKYWGKSDEELNLPTSGSLSLTLDALYTDTYVSFEDNLNDDVFYLNNVLQNNTRVSRFIDIFRKLSGINKFALVKSTNNFPTASGLASSASGFAALAGALNVATGLNLGKKELSSIARRGSGSAARSIYGGFVEWITKGKESYGKMLDDANWDIGMIIVVLSQKEKAISSREGMKISKSTSPFYSKWVETSKSDLKNIKEAILKRDFEVMGDITERNSFLMHAIMISSNPVLLYWEPDTLNVIQMVKELRKDGIMCYLTIDAGANVNILCRLSQANLIKSHLCKTFNEESIIISKPGSGIKTLNISKDELYG